MKTLYYFRHSVKDGVANTIGTKGVSLAEKVGQWMYRADDDCNPDKLFVGPLIRTLQTAFAFFRKFGSDCDVVLPELMPVVMEIGDDQLFGDMTKPAQLRVLANEIGNYRALLACHDADVVDFWIARATAAVTVMFDCLGDGETGVAFGQSPMIEFAIAGLLQNKKLADEYSSFAEMEGVIIDMEDEGNITVVRKLSMPAATN